MHRLLCTLTRGLLGLALALATGSVAAQEAAPTMPIEEIQRGQTGYGLSVFEGSDPVRFEVEVLGVMRDSAPGQSVILARLSGQGLEETGVIAGMSGSPVYVDERLVGAVAFAWPFSNGAVGGITPIDAMLALPEAEPAGAARTAVTSVLAPNELRTGDLGPERLRHELERLAPALPDEARSGLVWSLSGFGGESRRFLRSVLAGSLGTGLAPTGSASQASSGELRPGSAVAGVLVNGDLKMAVTGTVTERIGDEVYAFGHPFIGQGPLRLPMAHAEIVTVLSSQMVSFKISNVGDVIGAFDMDRSSGVRGRIGKTVRTIPLHVSLGGLGDAEFDMELADLPAYLPLTVATSGLGALDVTTRALGGQSLDLRARWELDRYAPIEVEMSFDGANAGFNAVTFLFLMTNYLVNNPLEEVGLQGVTIDLDQYPSPRAARIVGGFADRTVAAPGETIRVTLDMEPYDGEPYKKVVPIELPEAASPGTYSLILGDGISIDTIRQTIEQVVPDDLEQALAMVRRFHSNRDLVLLGLAPSWGLSVAGEVLPQLPASMRRLWQGVTPGVAKELGLAAVQTEVWRVDEPLSGAVRVDVRIERPTIVGPEDKNKERQ